MKKTFRGQVIEVGNLEVGNVNTGVIIEVNGERWVALLTPHNTREAARCLYEFVTITIEFPDPRPAEQE